MGLWLPNVPFSLCTGVGYCHLINIFQLHPGHGTDNYIFERGWGRGNYQKVPQLLYLFGLSPKVNMPKEALHDDQS